MSVAFDWDARDFSDLLASCDRDTATPYILQYMPKHGIVLEAGCGLARYVAFLSNRGFNAIGIELNQETVNAVGMISPHLDVRQGDVTALPFEDNSVSGIISLGVVEHFIDGPEKPLKEMLRVLEPGGYAVITVPSFNFIRKIKYRLSPVNPIKLLKQSQQVRKFFGKEPIKTRPPYGCFYHPGTVPYESRFHLNGDGFFEYLFSKPEFEGELTRAGYIIVESVPVNLIDGIYHDISKKIVPFRNWRFYPSVVARILNHTLRKIPFCHNHMHLCVARK